MRLECIKQPGVYQAGAVVVGQVVTGLADTSLVQLGARVTSTTRGLAPGTLVQSIDSATQVTLTKPAIVGGTKDLAFTLEPILLADARNYLKQDVPDDDPLISTLITSARRYCETKLRQAFITQTWRLFLDSFPSAGGYYNRAIREIWPSLGTLAGGMGGYPGLTPNSTGIINIPMPPLQSIDAVEYYDSQNNRVTVDPSVYIASTGTPARIQPNYSTVWPLARPTIDAVQITFTAGRGDTPDVVPENVMIAMMMLVDHWYANRGPTVTGTIVATVPKTVDSLLNTSGHGFYA